MERADEVRLDNKSRCFPYLTVGRDAGAVDPGRAVATIGPYDEVLAAACDRRCLLDAARGRDRDAVHVLDRQRASEPRPVDVEVAVPVVLTRDEPVRAHCADR